jgi:hypothetical protein
MQDNIQAKKFINDLKSDVDRVWKSTESSEEKEYNLPSKINAVCFSDDDYENLFFQADKYFEGGQIEHIDILEIISTENPFCIENVRGKVELTLIKEIDEALVTITR